MWARQSTRVVHRATHAAAPRPSATAGGVATAGPPGGSDAAGSIVMRGSIAVRGGHRGRARIIPDTNPKSIGDARPPCDPAVPSLESVMIPAPGRSRPLTADDLGLPTGAIARLAGSLFVRGRELTVRVETIEIVEGQQGRTSIGTVIGTLHSLAREAGMDLLVIEGVSLNNPRLSRVLIRRHGAIVTPQRTLVMSFPLES